MPTVKVGDINMYYEIHGEGEPLLLTAGGGMGLAGWARQTPEFSEKYRVIVFDNRGAGRTDAPDTPYSIEMMADDTAGLLDALGIEKAHILGLSMGGMIAQEFALKYPQRVKSLILATTTASPYPWAKHIIDTWARMAQEGLQTGPCLLGIARENLTKATTVGGELLIQQGHGPAMSPRAIHQKDFATGLSQVESSCQAGQTGSYDQNVCIQLGLLALNLLHLFKPPSTRQSLRGFDPR